MVFRAKHPTEGELYGSIWNAFDKALRPYLSLIISEKENRALVSVCKVLPIRCKIYEP